MCIFSGVHVLTAKNYAATVERPRNPRCVRQRSWALTHRFPKDEDKAREERYGPLDVMSIRIGRARLLDMGLERLDTVVVSDSRPEGERREYGDVIQTLRKKTGIQV